MLLAMKFKKAAGLFFVRFLEDNLLQRIDNAGYDNFFALSVYLDHNGVFTPIHPEPFVFGIEVPVFACVPTALRFLPRTVAKHVPG